MSVQATSWVWEHSQAEGTTLLVLLAVADAANKQGRRSCQSVATVAAMTRVSERTVQRALKSLQESGELVASGTDPEYRTVVYDLPKMAAKGDAAMSPSRGDIRGREGDKQDGLRVTKQGVEGDTAMSHYPSNPTTTPEEHPNAAEASGALFVIQGGEPEKPKDPARLILDYWWKRQSPKPAGRGAYHSGLRVIQALLVAGHTPKAVQDAACTMGPPLTIARMEIVLGRTSPKGGTMSVNHDHWSNGGGFTAQEGPTS